MNSLPSELKNKIRCRSCQKRRTSVLLITVINLLRTRTNYKPWDTTASIHSYTWDHQYNSEQDAGPAHLHPFVSWSTFHWSPSGHPGLGWGDFHCPSCPPQASFQTCSWSCSSLPAGASLATTRISWGLCLLVWTPAPTPHSLPQPLSVFPPNPSTSPSVTHQPAEALSTRDPAATTLA